MNYSEVPLTNNETHHKFEMFVDGHRSFIDYMLKNDKIYLVHTEVPQELEGRGVASELMEKTLHYIEDHHLKMVPLCAYVQHFLKRHPEWNRVVA